MGAHLTPITRMPWEMIDHILQYLQRSDLAKLARVNKSHYILLHNLLWEHIKVDRIRFQLILKVLNRPPLWHLPRDLDLWFAACRVRNDVIKNLVVDTQEGDTAGLVRECELKFREYCPHARVQILRDGTSVEILEPSRNKIDEDSLSQRLEKASLENEEAALEELEEESEEE